MFTHEKKKKLFFRKLLKAFHFSSVKRKLFAICYRLISNMCVLVAERGLVPFHVLLTYGCALLCDKSTLHEFPCLVYISYIDFCSKMSFIHIFCQRFFFLFLKRSFKIHSFFSHRVSDCSFNSF